MKIYQVTNVNKDDSGDDDDDDTTGDREWIEDESDFGACFEDINVSSGEQIYFVIELIEGYVINVDLNGADCKDDFQFTIPKTDLKNETEWMESWQEILTQIGKKINNNEWEKEFSLLNKENDGIINKKLEDFINVFRNCTRGGPEGEVAHFYLRV